MGRLDILLLPLRVLKTVNIVRMLGCNERLLQAVYRLWKETPIYSTKLCISNIENLIKVESKRNIKTNKNISDGYRSFPTGGDSRRVI